MLALLASPLLFLSLSTPWLWLVVPTMLFILLTRLPHYTISPCMVLGHDSPTPPHHALEALGRVAEWAREWGEGAAQGSALGEPECWHGVGALDLEAIRVWECCLPTPFLMVSRPCPQLLTCDHSQPLTSLFFLQGLCLNEAKLFLTQVTYLSQTPWGAPAGAVLDPAPTPVSQMSIFGTFSP